MTELSLDALVVGAGFGGIYQLKKLRDQGLTVKLIDIASDVGGTWFWNRYPGAMSDTEAYLYRYSWDAEDLQSYPWSHHYVYQADVLGYLQHVAKRFDLRKDMQFGVQLTAARWDDTAHRWIVQTSTGTTFRVRYLITALGLLSKINYPDIPGIDDFEGEKYHTGQWPDGVNLAGKRVGVIGNGSTGVQVITAIAPVVEQLVSFQRNPQYSVPSGQRPVSREYRDFVNQNYTEIWREAKDESLFAFGFKEASRSTFSVTDEERKEIYETAWRAGGGFRFMFETFGDISTDEAANNEASNFIKAKIHETVKDPEKARLLTPTQLYARRPLCDAGYYTQFNRDNIQIVSLKETPITTINPKGILTSDGKEHELDVIIFATGFDASDGNYLRVAIQGRNGETLKEHWSPNGPTTYLGMCVPGFPNLLQVMGPEGPFSSLPPAIETQVEFISDIIEASENKQRGEGHERSDSLARTPPNGIYHEESSTGDNARESSVSDGAKTARGPVIEATPKAEEEWTELCDKMSAGSLFRKTDSWIFGANVVGKKHSVLFYFGGISAYRKVLRDIVAGGWKGFTIS